MKTVALIFPLVAMLLAGCEDSGKPAKSTSPADSGSVAGAPAEYLQSVAASQQKAVKTIDLTSINKAIEGFYVQEGRFPKTLEELVDKGLMHALPKAPLGTKFNYDAKNGVVTLQKDLGDE